MAVSQNFPNILPTLNLDFANQKELDPRVTFSRSSSGTYVGRDGLIKTARVNEPRFDHDPVSGVCNGLLVEESRTNLWRSSNSFIFSSAYWQIINATLTPNSGISPDGTQNAALLVFSNGNNPNNPSNNGLLPDGAALTPNGIGTVSFYVKSAGMSIVRFRENAVSGSFLDFDLSNGNISNGNQTQFVSPTIVSLNNGWWRVSFSTPSWTTSATKYRIQNGQTGDGVSGFYVWGAQLEVGSFPTSYISTTSSAVTRAADIAQITGNNFSSWVNINEGTVFVQAPMGNGSFPVLWEMRDSNPPDCPQMLSRYADVNQVQLAVPQSFSYTGRTTTINYSPLSINKYAGAYKDGNSSASVNGLISLTITSTIGKGSNALVIGRSRLSGNYHNGTVSRLTYYPQRLTDVQLQQLTR